MSSLPNILLIQCDQLRFDCLGIRGTHPVKTPHIDSLIGDGTDFLNAYTPIPVCAPARQSMLRGRRPETFGALWNYGIALPVGTLSPDDYSFVRDLRDGGYDTCHMGKWSINPKYNPGHFGYNSFISDDEYTKYRKDKCSHGFSRGYFGEEDPIPLEDSHSHWMGDRVMDHIEGSSGPWFLHVDFSEPHLPCRPSEPFSRMYDPADIKPWTGFYETFENKPHIQKQQLLSWGIEDMGWDDWAKVVSMYFAVISQVDDVLGRIFNRLKEKNIYDDTHIIFTADHGDMCGSHRMMDKHHILYDDVVRVPLVIKGAGQKKAMTYGGFVTHSLDLAPTMLEMAGIGIRDDFQGDSLLPCTKGFEKKNRKDFVVSTYNGQQFGLYTQRMIRNDRYKYIWNATDVDEFYDLAEDPGELNNLIGDKNILPILLSMRKTLYGELIWAEDPLFVNNQWIKRQFEDNRIL